MHAVGHNAEASSSDSGGATHTGGGAKAPQNFKKLIYSIYIIYILKNIACKNWSWPPPRFWVISIVLLKEREIILKSYNLRGLTN